MLIISVYKQQLQPSYMYVHVGLSLRPLKPKWNLGSMTSRSEVWIQRVFHGARQTSCGTFVDLWMREKLNGRKTRENNEQV